SRTRMCTGSLDAASPAFSGSWAGLFFQNATAAQHTWPRAGWYKRLVASLSSLSPIGTIGRYAIIGRLATGGMAEIFLARESSLDVTRHVVVKRVLPHIAEDPALVEMFLHEARLSMNLAHPNVCPIYELGESGG